MKKIKMAFLAIATLTLLATSTACSSRKVASAKASEAPSAKPEEESSANAAESVAEEKEAEKSTASNGGVIVPGATVKGAIEGSEVFIAGRTVTIPSLWVCDHEVTQEEYQSVMGENPSGFSGSNKPVENVSWYHALVYCNKRSIAEGLTPCYKINSKTNPNSWGEIPDPVFRGDPAWDAATCDFNANGYRLPTEAEWEYFARGGNTSNSGQTTYSGSNAIGNVAWYDGNSGKETHEVKTKAPNALGLYDISGNVWEWCWDSYGPISTDTPSTGAASSSYRIQRGGSWHGYDYDFCCAVSYRGFECANQMGDSYNFPGDGGCYLGFRVVRSVSKKDAGTVAVEKKTDQKTASNGGANNPLTVTGQIADSEVFIKGRTVEIWAKWCCDHEVTQEEYQSVMGENPSKFSGSNKPVEEVSWYDAIMYCNKKSSAAGRTPCYKVNGNADASQWNYTPHRGNSISGTITCDFTADGYRLPTEAEWEYFSRGGNTSNSGQTEYSGSDDIDAVAWYGGNCGYVTSDVKKKAANALGLYDMSGNVYEWCWDRDSDTVTSSTPSSGAASGSCRVVRGGSCYFGGFDCTVSYRRSLYPGCSSGNRSDYHDPDCSYYGFRVVCSRSE